MRKIYKCIIHLRERYLEWVTYKAEMRNIRRKKALWSKVKLSPAENDMIVTYWKDKSGQKVSSKWNRLYASYLGGDATKDYFPEILFSTKLEKKLSPQKFSGVLSDKGLMSSLFPGDESYRCPKTIVYNSYGTYTDENKFVISEKDAAEKMKNCGLVIIKPTVDTSSGTSVYKANFNNGVDCKSGKTVISFIQEYKENFIVQECVNQSQYLSRLCDKSLNTFRVITYIYGGRVFTAPLSLRMGTGKSFVDNIHAGGICIGITEDYKLRKYAFSEYGHQFDKHPYSGITFENYDIAPLQKIVEVAKRLHGRVPMLQMISWDWSLDENNIPVLIELNISGQSIWFPQMLNGVPFFGERTEYFANLIRN